MNLLTTKSLVLWEKHGKYLKYISNIFKTNFKTFLKHISNITWQVSTWPFPPAQRKEECSSKNWEGGCDRLSQGGCDRLSQVGCWLKPKMMKMGTSNQPDVDQKPATAWYDDFQSPKIIQTFPRRVSLSFCWQVFRSTRGTTTSFWIVAYLVLYCVFTFWGVCICICTFICTVMKMLHLPSSPKASLPYPPATQRFPASKLAQGLGRQIGAMCSALGGCHHFMKWFHKKSFFELVMASLIVSKTLPQAKCHEPLLLFTFLTIFTSSWRPPHRSPCHPPPS